VDSIGEKATALTFVIASDAGKLDDYID